jgi:hypothetical protein
VISLGAEAASGIHHGYDVFIAKVKRNCFKGFSLSELGRSS